MQRPTQYLRQSADSEDLRRAEDDEYAEHAEHPSAEAEAGESEQAARENAEERFEVRLTAEENQVQKPAAIEGHKRQQIEAVNEEKQDGRRAKQLAAVNCDDNSQDAAEK